VYVSSLTPEVLKAMKEQEKKMMEMMKSMEKKP
jgi:hypothetical protein